MGYRSRILQETIEEAMGKGKSIVLLGPRQTGKTTLLSQITVDFSISLLLPGLRQKYERDPDSLVREIQALHSKKKNPLVFIDEIQKVPSLLDPIQYFLDQKVARFLLSGSSARKIKRTSNINLLPGRLINLRLDPFMLSEIENVSLESILSFGTLPGIVLEETTESKERILVSYVESYLEEEIRSEALVRNLPAFGKFLELAAAESGRICNFRNISREIGVSHSTIADYYQILEDTLIVERIEPYTKSNVRKKLTKSPKFLFFDLGVARIASREAWPPSRDRLGQIFENFIGTELIRTIRNRIPRAKLSFWRDPDGPEVDFLLEIGKSLIPIEVKYTDKPSTKDTVHLQTFLKEHPQSKQGFLICNAQRPEKISHQIMAMPYKEFFLSQSTYLGI